MNDISVNSRIYLANFVPSEQKIDNLRFSRHFKHEKYGI